MDEVGEDGHRTEQGREREVRPVADAVPASIASADDPERTRRDHQIEEHLERPPTLRVVGDEPEDVVVSGDEEGVGGEGDKRDDCDDGGGGTRHGGLLREFGRRRLGRSARIGRRRTVRRVSVSCGALDVATVSGLAHDLPGKVLAPLVRYKWSGR
jgi:hypothetical protein